MFPKALAEAARLLPSASYAEIGRAIAGGHAPTLAAVAVLVGWTVLFCASGVLAYRRATVRA